MAQGYDKYELDNQTGQSFRFALNDILEAVATQNSGDNSPNTTNTSYPYQTWVDTTNDVVKIRDAATAGTWYSLYSVDANGQPTGAVATGSYSISTNDTGGTGGTTAVFVDTSQRVGIGTIAPSFVLDCKSTGTTNVARFLTGSTSSSEVAQFGRSDQAVNLSIDYDGSGAMGIGTTTAHPFLLKTGATEKARIDISGRLLVGTSSARTVFGTTSPRFLVESVSDTDRYAQFAANRDTANGFGLYLLKSRGTTNGSNTVVQSGDSLGFIAFQGTDGSNRQNGATIEAAVDGTPGTNDMPGRLVFSTTPDGTSSPLERIRLNSSGSFRFTSGGNGNIVFEDSSSRFYFNNATNASIGSSSAGAGSTTLYIGNAAIQVSSDARLKENIEDTNLDALDAISQIKVKDFTWNDPSDTSPNNRNARGTWTGLIAQELVEVLPFVVNAPRNEDDGSIDHDSEDIWTLDQSQLCPVLIKAMQQQQEIIASLEARLSALEAQ